MPKTTSLFDKFAENLSRVLKAMNITINENEFNHDDRLYLCPLSLKVYSHTSLGRKATDMLTVEHVPPKSSGGKVRCLTSKDVNNNASKLDIKLLDRITNVNALKFSRIFELKTKVEESLNFKLILDVNPPKPKLKFIGHMDNPKSRQVIQKLQSGGSFKVKMMVPSVNLTPYTQLAYLKNAYLIAFSEIGYEFIFGLSKIQHPFIDKMRLMIINADTLEDLSFVKEFDYPDKMEGLSIIRIENQKTALSVCYKLPLGNDNNLKIQVLFPNPYDDDFEFRDHFRIGMKFEYLSISSMLPIVRRDSKSCYESYWEIWQKMKIQK